MYSNNKENTSYNAMSPAFSGENTYDHKSLHHHIQGGSQTISNGDTLASGNPEIVSQILAEKENYISELENEINDMRKELEAQREVVIMHEMNNLVESPAAQRMPTSPSYHATEVNLQPYSKRSYNTNFAGLQN